MPTPIRMNSATEKPQAVHERDALAAAIHEAAVAAGIINADQPTTGPQLLMLLQDLTALATHQQPTKVVIVHRNGWIQKIVADHPVVAAILDFDTDGYDEDQKCFVDDEEAVASPFRDTAVDSDRVGQVYALIASPAQSERAAAPSTSA